MSEKQQFKELINAIQYASKKVKTKKWNLAEYYNCMADFFDYIELQKDADEHRALAKNWELENIK